MKLSNFNEEVFLSGRFKIWINWSLVPLSISSFGYLELGVTLSFKSDTFRSARCMYALSLIIYHRGINLFSGKGHEFATVVELKRPVWIN